MSTNIDRSINRLPVDEARDQMMVRIARMAYLQDQTQTQIANETGLNRWQVSRLLTEAREQGVVRIEIMPHSRRKPELEAVLITRFGLKDAIVVPSDSDATDSVTMAAGQYLAALKPLPDIIGVSWGRTMARVAHWLPYGWADGIVAVQINGTVALLPQDAMQTGVAETMARKGNGRFVPLPVPAIVGQRETREVLEQDRIVADVLQMARSAGVYCFSLGASGPQSALLLSGNVLPDEMQGLEASGAVGDVLGRFINENGEIVDRELDERSIGLSFEDLKSGCLSVAVACGADKHKVTLGALRAGLMNVLVTDEATAIYAVEHENER